MNIVATQNPLSLLLHQVRPDDVGNYTCVAENLINRRVSPPARLDIFGENKS